MDDPSDNELLKYIPMLEFLAVVEDVRQYIPKFVHGSFINFSVVYKVIMDETQSQSKSEINKPEKISINIFNENYSNYYLTPTQIETQNDNSVNYMNKSSYSLHNTPHTKQLNDSKYLNNFINYTPQTTIKKNSDQVLNRFPQRDERSSTSVSNYKKEESSYLKDQSHREKPRTSSVMYDSSYNYNQGGRDSKLDQFKPNKPIQLETQAYKPIGSNYPEARPASAIGTKFPSAAILSFTDMTNDLNKFIDNKEYSKFKEDINRNSELNQIQNKMNFTYNNQAEERYNEIRNLYSYGPSVRYDRNQSLNDLKGSSSNYQISNVSIKDDPRLDDSKLIQPSLNFTSMKQINKSYSINNQPSFDSKPSYLKSSTNDFSWGNTATNTRSYAMNNRSYNMNEFDYAKRPKNNTSIELTSNSNRISSSYAAYNREMNAVPIKPYESTLNRFEHFNNYNISQQSYEGKSFLGSNKNLLRISDGGNLMRNREIRDNDRNFRYRNNY